MENELKLNREWDFVKRFVYNLVLSVFFVLLIAVILVKVFSLRLDEVLSDSMYPVFKKSDVVVVKEQDEYKVGDVIEYKKGEGFVAHRIVAYDETTGIYTTKGEFYGAPDDKSVTKSDINGKIIAVWTDGANYYHMVKDNYLVLLSLAFGAWVLSYTFSTESEMKKHNILKI